MEPKTLKVGQLNKPAKWKYDENTHSPTPPTAALTREKARFSAQAAVLLAFFNGGQVAVIANDPLI